MGEGSQGVIYVPQSLLKEEEDMLMKMKNMLNMKMHNMLNLKKLNPKWRWRMKAHLK